MIGSGNLIVVISCILALVGFFFGWYFYLSYMRTSGPGRQRRATFISLILISIAMVLWPIARLTMPSGDLRQLFWMVDGSRIALVILLAGLVFGFFGQPRLIVPIFFACVGTGVFWVVSSLPA